MKLYRVVTGKIINNGNVKYLA